MNLLAAAIETQQQQLEFPGLPTGWGRLIGLGLLVALGWLVIWLYGREARVGATRRLRMFLAGVRCAVIALLAVIWIEPVLATHILRTHTGRVAVLADVSASMTIPDAGGEAVAAGSVPGQSVQPAATRLAAVERLLTANDHAWLKRLAERNDLTAYGFGRESVPVQLPPELRAGGQGNAGTRPSVEAPARSEPTPDESTARQTGILTGLPLQQGTDLGQALATATEDIGSEPGAGVVLLTDAAVNAGMGEEELLAYAERLGASAQRVPIYAVGVGDLNEPPNARVVNLSAPATVSKGDPFEVRVEVAAEGFEPITMRLDVRAARLDLQTGSPAGESRSVVSRAVEIGGDRQPPPVTFQVTPQEAGEFVYRAELRLMGGEERQDSPGADAATQPAAVDPREAVTADNVRETNVVVLDDRIRVLIVSGAPSYDYRYVTRLLERDKTVDVSCWLQSADVNAIRDGDIVLRELPRQPEDVFVYDAVLLMDPSPGDLDSSWAINVRRLVDEFGGGLLYQAGQKFGPRFLREPAMADLVAVFPIVPDEEASLRLSELGSYVTRASPIRIPDENRPHPLLNLADDPQANSRLWASLTGVYSYIPVLREKPVAAVLLRHAGSAARNQHGEAVLMAAQAVGAGRCAFLAFDTTWRWRATAEPQFNRFWVQAVRYLSQMRRQAGSKRGSITIDRERLSVGEPFKLEVRVLDESFNPWHEQQIAAEVELISAERRAEPISTTLRAIAGRDGWYTGRIALPEEGLWIMRVKLPAGGSRPGSTPAAAGEQLTRLMRVHRPDIEMQGLRQRADLLKKLAELTGGRYCTLAEAERLPDWIHKASRVTPIRGPVLEMWDNWWMLGFVAGLLSLEWALRRKNHLL